MITTRRVPRTRRLLVAGLVLSALIHLFGGALWAHANHFIAQIMRRLPEQNPREQQIATSDVIHLEKRAVPRPAQAARAQPAARPVPRPRQPSTPRHVALPKPVVRQPVKPPAKPAPSAAPEIAHRVRHAPPLVERPQVAAAPGAGAAAGKPRSATLTAAQLAQLNAQFAQTIAASHVDLATIQKQTEQRPVATKHYPMQFTGLQANLQRGEGYIEPTTMGQRIGGTIWYYTHYTYMWPDGHLEDDDIPWPFGYPVGRDLFALHIHLIPLQLPPPGFRLTRPLKPFLAHFLQTAGPR
jgi:hypothetical protein